MLVNQIAVFLENRSQRLHALAKTLSEAGVDLVSMNIADTSDFGIVRLITDDNKKAIEVLKASGFTVKSTDLVGVEIADEVGGLTNVLGMFSAENINIEYLYSFARLKDDKAVILFKTDETEKALNVLKKHNMK